MMRKSAKLSLVAMVMVVSAALVFGGMTTPVLAKDKKIKLRGQAAWGRGIKQLWGPTEKVAQFINFYTGGKIEMELHTGGELVGTLEEYTAAGIGAIDFGIGCPCYAMSRCYALPFFCDGPGNIGGTEKIVWLYNGGGLEIFQDLFKKHFNVMAFPYAVLTSELFLFTNKEIKSLDDVKGLKMRAAGLRADIMNSLGGSLVVIGASEVIPSMERGVIDAFEVSISHWGRKSAILRRLNTFISRPARATTQC